MIKGIAYDYKNADELENFLMLGKGKTAEVYKYGTDKVCKLFFDGYPKEYVELEFHNAIIMHDLKLMFLSHMKSLLLKIVMELFTKKSVEKHYMSVWVIIKKE